jgi:hypothetical protein
MNASPAQQLEIRFATDENGYHRWHEQRRLEQEKLAKKLGLPLNHTVEIWLKGGIRLRGALKLKEEDLFLPEARDQRLRLRVDRVSFTTTEVESFVRLD